MSRHSMQTVLDIDLDFFVTPTKTWDATAERLPDNSYESDSISEVQEFIEIQCNLNLDRPRPGQLFEHHDEAFKWWRSLIQAGHLKPPFHCIHVDAHSDLSMGDPSYDYLMTELLHRPVAERTYPREGSDRLNPGSFLAFALACGWIGRLTMVQHHDPIEDLPILFFQDFNPASGFISLKRCTSEALDDYTVTGDTDSLAFETEREIPFELFQRFDFKAPCEPDFVCLTRSPGYTPLSADPLFEAISRYIKVI